MGINFKALFLCVALVCFIVIYNVTTGRNAEPEIVVDEPVEAAVEPIEEPSEEVEPIKKEVYRVTAYCPCAECCGEWAINRPTDANGEPIVIGAWGFELVDGYSAASPMAFGTQVELDGIGTVEIQDRTAKWVIDRFGENVIDIYMEDHLEACEFGVQYIEGVIK